MSSTDQNTPAKPARRGRKAQPRNPKRDQAPSSPADQAANEEVTVATALSMETAPIEAAIEPVDTRAIDAQATDDSAPVEADAPPILTGPSAEAAPVSLQTIANAYGDYTRRSLEETRSFVERLKGAGSLDKAMQVQTEFAQQAFEIFVAQSQKIYGLHKELARQTMKPLQGLMNKPGRDQR